MINSSLTRNDSANERNAILQLQATIEKFFPLSNQAREKDDSTKTQEVAIEELLVEEDPIQDGGDGLQQPRAEGLSFRVSEIVHVVCCRRF
jgi:hypothetical protein